MARPDELTFAPLGGVGEIGMNLSIYGLGNRHQRSWLAVDLGVSFGDEEHLPGIDLIMPDIRFLEKERKSLIGLVLTHAHEDHFGAIMDLWPKLKCPIYATKFSAALFDILLAFGCRLADHVSRLTARLRGKKHSNDYSGPKPNGQTGDEY